MKRFQQVVATATFAITALTANPAAAVTLLVQYSSTTGEVPPFTFNVDSNPTPIIFNSSFFRAPISNATGFFEGVTVLNFYSANNGGLFDSFNFNGPQIYTGSTQAPSLFQSGQFAALLDDGDGLNPTGTVTISDISVVAGAAPEPATWAMMLVGFGVVGLGLRRRRQTTTLRFQ